MPSRTIINAVTKRRIKYPSLYASRLKRQGWTIDYAYNKICPPKGYKKPKQGRPNRGRSSFRELNRQFKKVPTKRYYQLLEIEKHYKNVCVS